MGFGISNRLTQADPAKFSDIEYQNWEPLFVLREILERVFLSPEWIVELKEMMQGGQNNPPPRQIIKSLFEYILSTDRFIKPATLHKY